MSYRGTKFKPATINDYTNFATGDDPLALMQPVWSTGDLDCTFPARCSHVKEVSSLC